MHDQKLSDFFAAIRNEKRITTSHICLYVTFFVFWSEADFTDPILITRRKVMEAAKIRGIATFHKCIRELSELGFIQYYPSKNPAINSYVYLHSEKECLF